MISFVGTTEEGYASSDLLPLRHGIYVLDDVSCSRLSNAVVISYWGDELNSQRTTRIIVGVEQEADRFHLTMEVNEEGDAPWIDRWVLRISDDRTFAVLNPEPTTRYRWCFESMP